MPLPLPFYLYLFPRLPFCYKICYGRVKTVVKLSTSNCPHRVVSLTGQQSLRIADSQLVKMFRVLRNTKVVCRVPQISQESCLLSFFQNLVFPFTLQKRRNLNKRNQYFRGLYECETRCVTLVKKRSQRVPEQGAADYLELE